MKIKHIVLSSMLSSLVFGYSTAHANIGLRFDFPGAENFCAKVANSRWSGTGTASGKIDCVYTGTVRVRGSEPRYSLDVSLKRKSGDFICPKTLEQTLTATCSNNHITIYNDYVTMSGTLTNANTIDAKGTAKFLGITDKISMQVERR